MDIDSSDRLQAIHIATPTDNIVIINTYMPTNGTMADTSYDEVLDEVFEVMEKYSTNNSIIWIGDINAAVKRAKPTSNDKLFIKFCLENKLTVSPLTPDAPTYYHFSGGASSQIDLVITPEEQAPIITAVHVDVRAPANTSPHDAIIASTSHHIVPAQPSTPGKTNTKSFKAATKVKWKKVDKEKYATISSRKLDALTETTTSATHTDIIVKVLNKSLYDASMECQPTPRKPKKPSKFKWHPELKPMMEASKRAHWEWKSVDASKEQSNPLYIAMKVAKLHLRKTQRQLAASERSTLYEEIMSAKTADPQLFYKLVRRQRDSPYSRAADIAFADDLPGDNEAQKWASYFASWQPPSVSQITTRNTRSPAH